LKAASGAFWHLTLQGERLAFLQGRRVMHSSKAKADGRYNPRSIEGQPLLPPLDPAADFCSVLILQAL